MAKEQLGLQKQRKIPQKEGTKPLSSITSANQVGHSSNWDLYLSPIKLNNKETDIIRNEISKLLDKQVIEFATHCPREYIPNTYIRPKKDGGHRLILNLAKLNEQVQKRHFKMQTLTPAIHLITPQCFIASIDWKDAYYSVPVASEYWKYLCFGWQGKVFQFTCLPNGLSSAPRLFAKITKPLFSHLTLMGH